MKGCLRSFQLLMNARILIIRSRTEGKTPRRMAWRSMMPNQTSTRFSQDPEVGVKWTWIRGFAASHAFTFGPLVGGVVVHHQMQILVGIGPGQVFEEGEELLVAVALLAQPGHLPGGN